MTGRRFIRAGCILCLTAAAAAENRRVAITVDDGPVVNAGQDLERFQKISEGLMSSLLAEKVPATIFINERQLNVQGQRDARAAVVIEWLDAGFDLGNHSYSHPSLNRVPLWQFQDDVVRGDVIMRSLLEQRGRKLVWFRYPFLHSGTTAEIHQGILDFLEEAMNDPAYQRPDTFTGPGGSWLSRTAASRGRPLEPGSGPRVPEWITELPRQRR